MRISTTHNALLLMALMLVGCAPNPTSSFNPIGVSTPDLTLLPDLTIELMYLEMEGRQETCVEAYTPYGIRVRVENIGLADAGPFVVDLNDMQQQVDEGLAAGQSIELHFRGTVPDGSYFGYADATDQVIEYQEDNNSLNFLAPTPTPPPLCAVTPTSMP